MNKRLYSTPLCALWLAVVWLVAVLPACQPDGLPGGRDAMSFPEGLSLTLSPRPMDKLVPMKSGVNSFRDDKSKIDGLDIVLANGDAIIRILPVEQTASAEDNPGKSYLAKGALPQEDGMLAYHIGSKDLEGATDVYVVANYRPEGREVVSLATVEGLATVTQLKSLKQGNPVAGADPMVCTMFGEAALSLAEEATGSHAGEKKLSVELVRTVSMVTLAIDGSGLHPGIVIHPVSFSLHQLPVGCSIYGEKSNHPEDIRPTGQSLTELGASWPAVGNPEGTKGEGIRPVAPFGEPGSLYLPEGPHGNGDHVNPLFMFENCRGTIQNGIPGKVPGTDSPLEMKATYLEVKATYMYSSSLVKEGVAPPAFGEEQLAGTIIYRFWLGENAVDNYDVVRNKHYMVTLRLKGWGGLVEEGVVNKEDGTYREGEDVSWRVDTNLTTGTTVLEQDKLDVPACGSVVEIILTGDFGGATTISYTSTGNNNFVWLKKKDKKSGGWIWGKDQSTTDYATSVEEMGGGTYKIKCFVEPVGKETFNGIMAANPTLGQWKEKGKRSTGFKITGNGGKPVFASFTITQWMPMPVFDSYYYTDATEVSTARFFYDRQDVHHGEWFPWCSGGYQEKDLSSLGNGGSGFDVCAAFFRSVKEEGAWGVIDFNDGYPHDLMSVALFEAANSEPLGNNEAECAIMDPRSVTSLKIASIPTLAEWNLIEQYGAKDDRWPLIPGVPYWSSSIPADEPAKTFMHIYGTGPKGVPRNRAAAYAGRLVYRLTDEESPL